MSTSNTTATRTGGGLGKAADLLRITCFALVVLGPMVYEAVVPRKQRAAEVKKEARLAAVHPPAPEGLAALEQWPRAFEDWYTDHFGFRTALIRWHNAALLFGLATSPSERVILGRDRTLFLGTEQYVEAARRSNPFDAERLELWCSVLRERQAWCDARGIEYLFALAPDKSSIYPDDFPARYRPYGSVSRQDQLIEHLAEHAGVRILDLRVPLRAAAEKERVYYRLGTHWNSLGAWVAYDALLSAVNEKLPGCAPLARSEFWEAPAKDQGDTWAVKLHLDGLLMQDERQVVHKRSGSAKPRRLPWRGDHVAYETPWDWKPRAVVFHDSFGLPLRLLMPQHFSRIAFVRGRYFLPVVVEAEQPDVVIQLLVERDLQFWKPNWEYERSAKPKGPGTGPAGK